MRTAGSKSPVRPRLRINNWLVLGLLLAQPWKAAPAWAQQGAALLVGQVRDSSQATPVGDAVVTVTSPALQGEEIAVTDADGSYQLHGLPPGSYTVRVETGLHKPYERAGIELRADSTIRVNVGLLPEALEAEEVVVVGKTPSVDVGSSATGFNITHEFTERVPLAAPGQRGSAARSFQSVAEVVPTGRSDPFGLSLGGASSPENRYLIDGQVVGDPTFGLLGTALSIEFIDEVSVLTGGYMPEYGRSTGGILNAITKSGTNEWHASVFGYWAPGALVGNPKDVTVEGSTIQTGVKLAHQGDLGGDVSGPLIKDKLWLYAGFDWARTTYDLKRSLHRTLYDADGSATGTELISGSRETFQAQQDLFQGIAKLDWRVDGRNRASLSINGVYPVSGRDGKYSIETTTGQSEILSSSSGSTGTGSKSLSGEYGALARKRKAHSTNIFLKWSTKFEDTRSYLDTWVGWHNEVNAALPTDGSGIGSAQGLSGRSNVWWLGERNLDFFEEVPGDACAMANPGDPLPCPVREYRTGGPEAVWSRNTNRYQARSVFTQLFDGFGDHTFKAGVDLEYTSMSRNLGFTGARSYMEVPDFGVFLDGRVQGFTTAPDTAVELANIRAETGSLSAGAFVQDSWIIDNQLTINAGLRYDTQYLFARSGARALSLPNQVSPRVGAVWDWTKEGRAKVYANWARYYEQVPMLMADRYLTGEPFIWAARDAAACDFRTEANGLCATDATLAPFAEPPGQTRYGFGVAPVAIDPDIKAPATDELVLGGEYEVFEDGRVGLSYTRRTLVRALEDMSRDEAATYFFGNPGEGLGSDFPKAKRNYDALVFYLTKMYSNGWVGQASYTLSWLRGNYSGLFVPTTLQLDPHQNSDFDILSTTVNRSGPLPGDHRHFIKLNGGKEFNLGKGGVITPGGSFRAYSGEPYSQLGAHPLYGPDEVFIKPRGDAGRLGWTYSMDLRLGYRFPLNDKGAGIAVTADVFNVFNFQRSVAKDGRYTSDIVKPITDGSDIADLTNSQGDPVTQNPNFGNPLAFQAPRTFRFGLKGTY